MEIWILATFVAFFIKGLCGFANTLVFTSILGFGANNINISPVELVLGYPANVIVTWKNRKGLNPKVFIPLASLVLAGSIPGAFLLKNVDATYIKIVFGVITVLIGIEMFLRETRPSETSKIPALVQKILLTIIGVLSGIMCGMFGVGALLAAYIGRATETSKEFKANICAVFAVENTFRIILYSVIGIITWESLKQSVLLLPVMLIGLWAGIKSAKFLNEKTVKMLVIVLLILSGVVLVIKNI